jgi:SAM-dependent methyltransferase
VQIASTAKTTSAKKRPLPFLRLRVRKLRLLNRDVRERQGVLHFPERSIRRTAHRRFPEGNMAWIAARQALTESWVRLRTHMSFRSRRNEDATRAYCAMSAREFEGINLRQAWANWRTIPRCLSGRLPARPARALDLCCGTGQSTDVLAHYLAPGSQIHGLEFNAHFVALARARRYRDRRGATSHAVTFRAQSVLETFRRADGRRVDSQSQDVVTCCGALGHHFEASSARVIAREIARVLRPGGLALLDSGPHGTRPEELTRIFRTLGFKRVHSTRSCLLDRYTQLCFQKPI